MSKTLVMVNTLTQVHQWAYSSHCQEWFRMGKDFPEDDFFLWTPCRSSIDRSRNQAVQLAMEVNADYIYFIDDDMILAPRTYRSLRQANKDVVMAHSVIRGYPYQHMMFIDPEDKYFESDKRLSKSLILWDNVDEWKSWITPEGLLRVDAVGCAAVLYKTSLFSDIPPPWFVTLPNMTEDVYCNLKMQEAFGRSNLQIFVDTKVPTGHILYSQIACASNRDDLRLIDEKANKALNQNADRGDAYMTAIEEAFNVNS